MEAYTTLVSFGGVELEGVMFEDNTFGITVPQICSLLKLPTEHAKPAIKSFMGRDFQFVKYVNPLNPEGVDALQLDDFELFIAELDRFGNREAQQLRDLLVGLALTKLFSDSFWD